MNNLINWLEGKITSCEELGGMEKEKWAFIQTLKKVRKEAIAVTPCCTELKDFCTYTLNENENVIDDLIKDFKNKDL